MGILVQLLGVLCIKIILLTNPKNCMTQSHITTYILDFALAVVSEQVQDDVCNTMYIIL